MEVETGNEALYVVGVLARESLTRGEGLVGVVGDGEVCFTICFDGVRGVVLIVAAGAGAVDGNGDEGVGGDGLDVGDIVGGSDGGGVRVEEVRDGDRGGVIWVGRFEGEVGCARWNTVAKVAICGVGFVIGAIS